MPTMADFKSASIAESSRTDRSTSLSAPENTESKYAHDSSTSRRARSNVRTSEGGQSALFSAEALDNALLREATRPQRESTPSASPHRKRQRINGDRYVIETLKPLTLCFMNNELILLDLFPQDLDKTFRQASVSFTTMVHPQPHPN